MFRLENVLCLVCISSHQAMTCYTARLLARRFLVSSFRPPYSAFVVKAIKGPVLPCLLRIFLHLFPTLQLLPLLGWIVIFFFCVCPHMLMQNSSPLSCLTVVWSRGVDIIVQQSEQMNDVPPGVWKQFPQDKSGLCLLCLFIFSDRFYFFSNAVKQRSRHAECKS